MLTTKTATETIWTVARTEGDDMPIVTYAPVLTDGLRAIARFGAEDGWVADTLMVALAQVQSRERRGLPTVGEHLDIIRLAYNLAIPGSVADDAPYRGDKR